MNATRRFIWSILAMVLVPLACSAGDIAINPTTSLAAETTNNTSTPGTFLTQANGNMGAANISKLDIHSLLYPSAKTKVLAHLVLWFGRPDHMNVGYSSTDPAQVKRQITDMISRGIDGVVMVWYGPNNSIDRAAKLVMSEAEAHPGFNFAVMVDNGAIRWNSCAGCNPQQALIQDLQYVEQTYFSSPAYLRVDGRPVITNFDIDLYYKVDWSAVRTALANDPLFLFQNSGGFSHVGSSGAYSWDIPTTTDYGMNYLTNFYNVGLGFLNQETWGSSYKGFDDTQASWGLHRVMTQQCGQTWLKTFSKVNQLYNSTNQLAAIQLVTWNDYEEGTEIESGIDNCVNVAAAVDGGSLRWNVTGSEDTVDHYTVYVSTDGQKLMPIADTQNGLHALDICGYELPAGNYTLFVQAVGKPNLSNHMSRPVSYTANCASPIPAATMALSASPSAVSLLAGQTARILVSVQSAGLQNPLSLSCSGLPVGMSCAFSPAVLKPGSGSSVLGITVTRAFPARKRPIRERPEHIAFRFGAWRGRRRGMAPAASSFRTSVAYPIKVNGVSGTTEASTSAVITIR